MLPNFSKRLIEEYSQEFRDKIFGDYQIPPFGTNLNDHNKYAIKLFERYLAAVSEEGADRFFAIGLRDKYTQSYVRPKEMYDKSKNLDEFLDWYRDNFINNIKKHRDDSSLFYIQEVDNCCSVYKPLNERMIPKSALTKMLPYEVISSTLTSIPNSFQYFESNFDVQKMFIDISKN